MGYKIVSLPPPIPESVEVGLKYTNNEVCYPGIVVVGDLVRALRSGQYDLGQTAVGFSQTGGPCRATSYASMIKKGLVWAGLEQVPVVTLSTNLKLLNDQPGFDVNISEYIYKAALSLVFCDFLSDMYHSTIIREVHKGQTQAVVDKYLGRFMDGTIPVTRSGLLEWLGNAVQDFNAVETDDRYYPRVGVIGEVYVKYNDFSNSYVIPWLIDQGLEVVLPGFFGLSHCSMATTDHMVRSNVKKRDRLWLIVAFGLKMAEVILGQFNRVMRNYRRYHPHPSIKDIAAWAEEVLDLNHEYGEGWLIAGEIGALTRAGVNNILCLQPFGCIANHIVAKGVQKRLQDTYPDLNLLLLDADAGVSEVNFFNRMHFFVNHAKNAPAEFVYEHS
jgi:predicted nucleotide-binding protein (sugar kinase/HSP70/actin superfamily)